VHHDVLADLGVVHQAVAGVPSALVQLDDGHPGFGSQPPEFLRHVIGVPRTTWPVTISVIVSLQVVALGDQMVMNCTCPIDGVQYRGKPPCSTRGPDPERGPRRSSRSAGRGASARLPPPPPGAHGPATVTVAGELRTRAGDKSGDLYSHDVQVSAGPNTFAAPQPLSQIDDIGGVLYVGSASYGCSIASQPCLPPAQVPA
jgi:hypothetical protein